MPRNQANLRSVCQQDARAKHTVRRQAPFGANVDDGYTVVHTKGASFEAYAATLALRIDRGEVLMSDAVRQLAAVAR